MVFMSTTTGSRTKMNIGKAAMMTPRAKELLAKKKKVSLSSSTVANELFEPSPKLIRPFSAQGCRSLQSNNSGAATKKTPTASLTLVGNVVQSHPRPIQPYSSQSCRNLRSNGNHSSRSSPDMVDLEKSCAVLVRSTVKEPVTCRRSVMANLSSQRKSTRGSSLWNVFSSLSEDHPTTEEIEPASERSGRRRGSITLYNLDDSLDHIQNEIHEALRKDDLLRSRLSAPPLASGAGDVGAELPLSQVSLLLKEDRIRASPCWRIASPEEGKLSKTRGSPCGSQACAA
jgi:hypothetical protein